jgi:hypothetical protein
MKLSPEVLIYIQTVKSYFEKSKEAREYFIGDSNVDLFFEHLGEISQKNFDKDGEVMLNKEQFELLRKTIRAISVTLKKDEELIEVTKENIFFKIPNFGEICLN